MVVRVAHATSAQYHVCLPAMSCRPLIVQMVHDPSALEPRCRLQEEDGEEYGPPIAPETAVAEAIMKRTKEHLRQLGNAAVSSKPIVMRAE